MDGRTEGQRIERDPTMDNHIVHAVSVSNKKEQSQLREKERNLQNEFKVEQHIIRREEKSLLKQFHKLQLQKYHRHHEELHSPRGSERRLLSAYEGVTRSGHSMHHSRLGSPASSGHGLHKARHDDQSHPMTSHSSMRLSHQYPSSSMISSNYAPSYASSTHSTHKSAEGGLLLINSQVRSHGGSTHDHRHRRDVMTDDEDSHHQYHAQPTQPHQQQHSHTRDEIESLVDSYMLPQQPAGYGHSIKDERRDPHYHRLHRDKHKHRRHTVDFDYPGNYQHIGILHRLNDIGPDSHSYSRIERPRQDVVPRRTSDSRLVPRNVSIEHEKQLLRGGVEKSDGRVHGQRTSSHTSIPPQGKHVSEKGQNLQITIQINRKKGDKPETDDVTKVPKSRSLEDKKPRGGHSSHNVAKSRSSLVGSNKGIGKEASRGHVHSGTNVRSFDQSMAVSSYQGNQADIDTEMLAELKAMSGNATQGYFTGQSGGFGNRRTRFKQLVKELLVKQMPAMARKRHLAEFDPLEALQCRYLRLSPANIQELVEMCKESGVDVDIHPHSEITDINKVVFPHNNKEDAQSG